LKRKWFERSTSKEKGRYALLPKNAADRIIMFCVIGLYAWTVIGLPIFVGITAPSALSQEAFGNRATECTQAQNRYECLVAVYTGNLAKFTELLALATVVLVIATFGLAWLAFVQFRDSRTLQRAYLKRQCPRPNARMRGGNVS
jgi:hypothetical protein